ncbi:MAG: HAD family phosphatase [Actinobacteria bacterium]|nr:HAD family phosphatase [Actinomycetota bacterium]
MTPIRVLYTDVDGTLVGPLGNLFWDGERRPTLEAAEAILRAQAEGLEIVPLSGRDRIQVIELARLIGAETWIGELGGVRSYGRGEEVVTDRGAFPGTGVPVDALAPALSALVAAHQGSLEEHEPWNDGRTTSLMVRGQVDISSANRTLTDLGLDWAEVVDNGVIPRRYEGLPALDVIRCYHLTPRGISKATGIAADRAHRGLAREECAVIGDARADLDCHGEVGRVFVVANAVEKDPELGPLVDKIPNAEVTKRGHGLGFADVVSALLPSS